MKLEKLATNQITNALLWATAMIGSSLILKDTIYYREMFYLLIALSTASFLLLEENRSSIQSKWRCIQKLLSRK